MSHGRGDGGGGPKKCQKSVTYDLNGPFLVFQLKVFLRKKNISIFKHKKSLKKKEKALV